MSGSSSRLCSHLILMYSLIAVRLFKLGDSRRAVEITVLKINRKKTVCRRGSMDMTTLTTQGEDSEKVIAFTS